MVHLYKTKNGIWDNYWPKHSAENTIDYKTDATNKIYNSNFAEVFQNKTPLGGIFVCQHMREGIPLHTVRQGF